MKIRIRYFLSALALAIIPLIPGGQAAAVANTGFKPGYIMSNDVMRNYTSMSVNQIHTFLKSKNSCNDTRTYLASWYPLVSYHIQNGHFVCMADELFNGKSAAKIIYDAAHKYKINPQVLIVLLQKEQGLVTDTWPNNIQYRSATGYGCPDTAACDAHYYGFENQINNAAALFDSVLKGGWTNYPPGYRYIKYSPNAACGGSTVYIRNRATSALYRYTPYQPNAAAIAAGYGTGDWCSSYGNRNFYRYFTDWFGNPVATGSEVKRYSGPANIKAPTATAPAKKAEPAEVLEIPKSTAFIADGEYQLQSSSAGFNLSTAVSSPVSGSKIQLLQAKAGYKVQIMRFRRTSDGYYIISNPATGLYLDLTGASNISGTAIQLYGYNGTCAQKWALQEVNGKYVLKSACNGRALGIPSTTSGQGAYVRAYRYDGSAAQQWTFRVINSSFNAGTYTMINSRGKALNVSSAGVTIADKSGATSQQFKFVKNLDGSFTVTNVATGQYLVASGQKAVLQSSASGCAARWFVTSDSNAYSIKNGCNGDALGAQRNSASLSGAPAVVTEYAHSASQLWTIATPDPSLEDGIYWVQTSSRKGIDFNAIEAPVYVQRRHLGLNQRYQFKKTADNYYQIINPATGKALAVAGYADRAKVYLKDPANTCHQKWFFTAHGDTYIVYNLCSGLALTNSGTDVYVTSYRYNPGQFWEFAKQ